MDISHLLGFLGGVIVYFVSLYYVGLNHWIVMEHNKIYSEFDAIKAELAQLKKSK
jgi:hypothetical protein